MGDIHDITEQRKKVIERIKKQKEADVLNALKSVEVYGSEYPNRGRAEASSPDLKFMNDKYAFVMTYGGRAMVMHRVYNEAYNREMIEYITPETLMQMYSNHMAKETLEDKKGPMSIAKWWLQHYHRKDYSVVTFEPDRPSGEYHVLNEYKLKNKDEEELDDKDKYLTRYNLWEGFGVEEKKGCWKKTFRHIYSVLCNGDRIKFGYVIRWLAWAVQNPGKPAEVAIIFKGKKGAGKGVILQSLVKMFGAHGMTISNREHLTGKHNEHLAHCCFLLADEAYNPGDKEAEAVLKSLITEPYVITEPKFRSVRTSRNCLHIAMATNSDWVISATEDERRYFINEVDNTYAKGSVSEYERQKYFTALWAELLDEGGLSAMLYDLKHMQLNGWHPRYNVPETEELKRQIAMSLPKLKYAFLCMLEDGVFPGAKDGSGYTVSPTNLAEYLHKFDSTKSINTKQVSRICKDLGIEYGRTNKARYYFFPELGEVRQRWNERINRQDWSLGETWLVQTDY